MSFLSNILKLSGLQKHKNPYEWESLGIINNSSEYMQLSEKIPRPMLQALCSNVDRSYGTEIHTAYGRTWKYKAVPFGSAWGSLRQGQHGSNETQIEIYRKLR